jgi:hypothetical protein
MKPLVPGTALFAYINIKYIVENKGKIVAKPR